MSLYEYAQRDLSLLRGVPFVATFRVTDPDGNPVLPGDHEIYAAIHATDAYDGTVLASFAVEVLDDETGDIALSLPQAATAGFAASRSAGWFYAWYSGPSTGGERRPLWRGLVTVR